MNRMHSNSYWKKGFVRTSLKMQIIRFQWKTKEKRRAKNDSNIADISENAAHGRCAHHRIKLHWTRKREVIPNKRKLGLVIIKNKLKWRKQRKMTEAGFLRTVGVVSPQQDDLSREWREGYNHRYLCLYGRWNDILGIVRVRQNFELTQAIPERRKRCSTYLQSDHIRLRHCLWTFNDLWPQWIHQLHKQTVSSKSLHLHP